MTKRIRLEVEIPFPGFYESWLSQELDHTEEREAENMEERDREEKPQALRLSASDYSELIFDCMDYSAAHLEIAGDFVTEFDAWASEIIGTPLGLRFVTMSSPREYNFTTDRVFVTCELKTLRQLFAASKAEGHETLSSVIRRRFTSRDGFSSFYSNCLADWLDKPFRDWDHNELGTLIRAAMEINAAPDDDDDGFMYHMLESECFYSAFEKGMDWAKFDAKIEEKRAELLAEIEDDEEREETELALERRCEYTAELFADLL